MAQLLAAAAGGLALGVIAALLGVAELRHRNRVATADDDTAEFAVIPPTPPIVAAPRTYRGSVRGRW
jgi:hypothetical protein